MTLAENVAFSLEEFTPISLSLALPTLLRQPWREVEGDSATNTNRGASERDEFEDFSLVRVTLGYGVPTLVTAGLAMLCFHRRDF